MGFTVALTLSGNSIVLWESVYQVGDWDPFKKGKVIPLPTGVIFSTITW
jgi:hypothetical protein